MNNTISFINNDDAVLLDAYSKTITGVVGDVAASVAHIQVNKITIVTQPDDGQPSRWPAPVTAASATDSPAAAKKKADPLPIVVVVVDGLLQLTACCY